MLHAMRGRSLLVGLGVATVGLPALTQRQRALCSGDRESTLPAPAPVPAAAAAAGRAAPPSGELSQALAGLRRTEADMRLRWERDEDNWRKLPARAWPDYQPDVEEIPALRTKVTKQCASESQQRSADCMQRKFDLATALTFNQMEGEEGLGLYRELAAQGHTDGMTALGICLLEGIPRLEDVDAPGGVQWLRRAAELNNIQSVYELGILYYTGSADPVIAEDEAKAFSYFEQSANKSHTCGLYMTALMMMKQEGGCSADPPRSLDLLYRAGERGHRTARAALLKILDEDTA
jgi:TPR repeat protein